MAGRDIAAIGVALTSNGTATGYAPVADSTGFWVGATVSLSSDTVDVVECIITSKEPTQLGLRFKSSAGYGRSDLSAYLSADSARVDQPEQLIIVPSIDSLFTFDGTTITALYDIAAPNDMGSNTGDVTLANVGSSPNAKAASLTGQILTLQPASSSFPGLITTGVQTLAGAKSFTNTITSTVAASGTAFKSSDLARWKLGDGANDYFYASGGEMVAAGALTIGSTLTTQGQITLQSNIKPWAGGDNSFDIGDATHRMQAVYTMQTLAYAASGSNAFSALTGARWKIGGGTTDYLVSNGTTKITAAGSLDVSGTIFADAFKGGGASGDAGNYTCNIVFPSDVSGITNANAMMSIYPRAAVDATDLLLNILDGTPTSKVTIDATGNVAATGYFSGVDLYLPTIADGVHNNAGYLQLKSTNGYTYGMMGTAHTQVTFGGVIDAQYTPVGNVTTGEDVLMTFSLPANTLTTATLRTLVHKAAGTIANNVNAKTLKVYFGSQILSVTIPISIAADWIAEATIFHTAANAQRYIVRVDIIDQALNTATSYVAQGTLTEATTAGITMKISGEGVDTNDIVQNMSLISVV